MPQFRLSLVSVLWITVLLVDLSVKAKVIDLSHKLTPDTYMAIRSAPGYNLTALKRSHFNPGVYVESNYYGTSEHGGTHIDAPSHFIKGGTTLDEIPLEDSIVEGVMIDCTEEAAEDPGYSVTVEKIQEWESENGEIPQGAGVLFNFGWSAKYLDEVAYRGTSDLDNQLAYIYPTTSVPAGHWLWENRRIRILGSDALSPDPFHYNGRPSGFPLHLYLLARNVVFIENARDLHKLPARNFRLHAAPVKFLKATGAQTRVYAVTYDNAGNGAKMICLSSLVFILSLLARDVMFFIN